MNARPKIYFFIDYDLYESHSNWALVIVRDDHAEEFCGTIEGEFERAEIFTRVMETGLARIDQPSEIHFEVADTIRLLKEVDERQWHRHFPPGTGHAFFMKFGYANHAADHFARARALMGRLEANRQDAKRAPVDKLTQWFGTPSSTLEPPPKPRGQRKR